ncbi:hypothetical protein [Tsuneonella sp. HG222]
MPGPRSDDAGGAAPRRGDGANQGLIPKDERGAGGGGPVGPKDAGKHGFHGGQSNAAYHGHGQLGEDAVEGQENVNAVSKDP